ncbi:MAG: DUF1697 domain-containing protein [Balneolaceae bacterium]
MIRYAALLRGINVGGYRKIKMNDLCDIFLTAGLKNITTYIQSGNVIFDSPETDTSRLKHEIETSLEKTAGFHATVLIRTIPELENIIYENPFEGRVTDRHKLYVTFFKVEPSPDKQQELLSYRNDVEEFTVRKRELYSLIDKKTSQKPLFSNNFIEKHFGMPATTRNWKTVNNILNLATIR